MIYACNMLAACMEYHKSIHCMLHETCVYMHINAMCMWTKAKVHAFTLINMHVIMDNTSYRDIATHTNTIVRVRKRGCLLSFSYLPSKLEVGHFLILSWHNAYWMNLQHQNCFQRISQHHHLWLHASILFDDNYTLLSTLSVWTYNNHWANLRVAEHSNKPDRSH